MILKIAFRNVLRNGRRSAMTLLAVAVGAVAIVLFGEFVAFVRAGLETNAVERAAWEMVNSHFSWEHVARCFEKIMESAPRLCQ